MFTLLAYLFVQKREVTWDVSIYVFYVTGAVIDLLITVAVFPYGIWGC